MHEQTLDLEKIEEELENISKFPWRIIKDHFSFRIDSSNPQSWRNGEDEPALSVVCYFPDPEQALTGQMEEDSVFIAKSPERIAALVKRVRDYEQNIFFDGKPISEVRKILDIVYKYCGSHIAGDFEIFMDLLFERLKQLKGGSDEVL